MNAVEESARCAALLERCCAAMGADPAEIRGPSRARTLHRRRLVAARVLRLAGAALEEISHQFDRDHDVAARWMRRVDADQELSDSAVRLAARLGVVSEVEGERTRRRQANRAKRAARA